MDNPRTQDPHPHPRHQYALGVARRYVTSWRDVVIALLIGVGGGIWNAVSGHANALENIGIAIGIVVGAIILGPLIVYGASWVFAGGHLTRERLSHIEYLLSAGRIDELHGIVSDLRSSPGPPEEPSEPRFAYPKRFIDLQRAFNNGVAILKRCPEYPRGEVPADLTREVATWKTRVVELLSPWPDYRTAFSGPLGFDANAFTALPRVTQEMMKRMDLLSDIVKALKNSEKVPVE